MQGLCIVAVSDRLAAGQGSLLQRISVSVIHYAMLQIIETPRLGPLNA